MAETDVEKIKTLTNKQVMSLLAGAIFTIFSLTTIYNKFVFNDEEIDTNTKSIAVVIKDIVGLKDSKASNERLDKKTKRIEDRVNELEEDVKKLKEPGSDN